MKKILCLCLLVILLVGCKDKQPNTYNDRKIKVAIKLPTTPVKDQGNSTLCWIYGMLATIETEHLIQGDSVNLSIDYLARAYLREQAMQRLYNRHRKDHNPISLRGMMPMTIDLLQTYGLQHRDACYRADTPNYNVITRKLTQLTSSNNDISLTAIDDYLDKHIVFSPRKVFLYGAVYSPEEFARSVCADGEYTAVTSFTHHPFLQRFTLEVPDNRFHNAFLNVPLDTMMTLIERSIRHHHPVCWEGDISEKGFDWQQGIADVDATDLPITAKKRQKAFENDQTTDDHVMEMMGLAQDNKGKKYIICKNSWGKTNRFGGFIFLSYDYIKLKTIAIIVKL